MTFGIRATRENLEPPILAPYGNSVRKKPEMTFTSARVFRLHWITAVPRDALMVPLRKFILLSRVSSEPKLSDIDCFTGLLL